MRSMIVSPHPFLPSMSTNSRRRSEQKKAYRSLRHSPSCSLFFQCEPLTSPCLSKPHIRHPIGQVTRIFKSASVRVHSFLPD